MTIQTKSQIAHLIQTAMKIMGVKNHPPLQTIYESSVLRQIHKIVSELTQILHAEFKLLPSCRRFKVPDLNCCKNSFLPMAIMLLNQNNIYNNNGNVENVYYMGCAICHVCNNRLHGLCSISTYDVFLLVLFL